VCVCGCVTVGRAVSEPYYSQRARSVCVSLSAFFIFFLLPVHTAIEDLDSDLKLVDLDLPVAGLDTSLEAILNTSRRHSVEKSYFEWQFLPPPH